MPKFEKIARKGKVAVFQSVRRPYGLWALFYIYGPSGQSLGRWEASLFSFHGQGGEQIEPAWMILSGNIFWRNVHWNDSIWYIEERDSAMLPAPFCKRKPPAVLVVPACRKSPFSAVEQTKKVSVFERRF